MQANHTFEEFVAICKTLGVGRPRSEWLREPGLKLYVRNGWLPDRHGDYVIANVNAQRPGKGSLTKFLDKYEPEYRFSFENVLNPRLVTYLKRRGYVYESGHDTAPCLIFPKFDFDWLMNLTYRQNTRFYIILTPTAHMSLLSDFEFTKTRTLSELGKKMSFHCNGSEVNIAVDYEATRNNITR
jgi:hypothetical protein